MSDANKHSAIKGYGDALKQEAELENARYKNDSSLRSSNDDMSDLFSSISEAAKSPGGRPRGIGASIAAGFSEGISTGYKMKSTNEKKEKYNKYNNVMSYLQKTQAEVTKQNQHYAEQEQRMETVKPFATGALEVAYSGMDYNQGNERMRNIIEQAKLADPSIKGDYLGYVPNSPIINMRDQNGNITAFSLSSLTGEDTVQRVQKNYIEGQKVNHDFQYKQDDTNIKKFEKGIPGGAYGIKNDYSNLNADQKFEFEGSSYDVDTLGHLSKKALAHYETKVIDEVDKIPKQNEAYKALQTMKNVFARNPNIGTSYIHMLESEDGMDGFMTRTLKKFAGKDLEDIQILKKATNDLNLDTILGISGKAATDLLKRAVQASSPNGQLVSGAFASNVSTWEEKVKNNIRIARAKDAALKRGLRLAENGVSYDEEKKETGNPQAQDERDTMWSRSQ